MDTLLLYQCSYPLLAGNIRVLLRALKFKPPHHTRRVLPSSTTHTQLLAVELSSAMESSAQTLSSEAWLEAVTKDMVSISGPGRDMRRQVWGSSFWPESTSAGAGSACLCS